MVFLIPSGMDNEGKTVMVSIGQQENTMLEHFGNEATSICSSAPRLSLPSDLFCYSDGNPSGCHCPWLSALSLCL